METLSNLYEYCLGFIEGNPAITFWTVVVLGASHLVF